MADICKRITEMQFLSEVLFIYFFMRYNIVKFQSCFSVYEWVIKLHSYFSAVTTISKWLLSSKVMQVHKSCQRCFFFHLLFVNYDIVKFRTCCSMHEWVIAIYSLLGKSNNDRMSFISFMICPTGLGCEDSLWKIMFPSSFCGSDLTFDPSFLVKWGC